jgi:hypothetical protein
LLSSFSPSPKNLIVKPPNTQYLILKCCPPTKLFVIFAMQSRISQGHHFMWLHSLFFMYPHCTAQWESCIKKCRWPWWECIHHTWLKRTNTMPWFWQFRQYSRASGQKGNLPALSRV